MSGVFEEQRQHLDNIDSAARPDICVLSEKLHDGEACEARKSCMLHLFCNSLCLHVHTQELYILLGMVGQSGDKIFHCPNSCNLSIIIWAGRSVQLL